MARKSWNHRKCAAHRKVEGYTAKVCILPGQDEEQIVRFAEVMYRLAAAFRRRIPKPATNRRTYNPHDACGGHITGYSSLGKLCYGRKGMSVSALADAKQEALDFADEIVRTMETNPRYARFYTGTVWS